MAASFVDRPEINSSWCSSHLFITIKLETFISLIYIELFAMCIPAQLQLMCALQANVFSFFFFVVVKRYICCAFGAQVCGDQRAHLDLSTKWRRLCLVLAECVCVQAGREVSVRARSAVKARPSACWEEEAWWQRKTWSFCRAGQQTQHTDISKDGLSLAMHVIRRRRDSQHGCGVIDVAPNSPIHIPS